MKVLSKTIVFVFILHVIVLDCAIIYHNKDIVLKYLKRGAQDTVVVDCSFILNKDTVDDYSIAFINLTSDGKGVWGNRKLDHKILCWSKSIYGISENNQRISNIKEINDKLNHFYRDHKLIDKMAYLQWIRNSKIDPIRGTRPNLRGHNYEICAWDNLIVINKSSSDFLYTFAQTNCSVLIIISGNQILLAHFNKVNISTFSALDSLYSKILSMSNNYTKDIDIYIVSNFTPSILQYCKRLINSMPLLDIDIYFHEKPSDQIYNIKCELNRGRILYYSCNKSLRDVYPNGAYAYPLDTDPFRVLSFERVRLNKGKYYESKKQNSNRL